MLYSRIDVGGMFRANGSVRRCAYSRMGANVKTSHYAKLVIGLVSIAIIATTSTVSSASSTTSGVRWGNAIEVRGLPTHSYPFGSDLFSVSCASAGNCSAGGNYALGARRSQAFLVDETNGVWGTAQTVPGLTARDASENTEVYVMSCPSAGNCGAGGTYAPTNNSSIVFVVNETNGVWARAIDLPGASRSDSTSGGFITSISCPSAGNCSAGGILPVAHSSTTSGAFVVDETNGVWGKVLELSGPAAFDHNGAGVDVLSCTSAGNCSAGGSFPKRFDGPGRPSFVVDETNGVWGKVRELTGFAGLNVGDTEFRALSCGAPGSCSAVGQYQQKNGVPRAFVASESKGVWEPAFNVPGLEKLNGRHLSALTTISCASRESCSAGGYYENGQRQTAFIVDELRGKWGTPLVIPGLGSLNKGDDSSMQTVSCVSNGNCGASGSYSDAAGNTQSFLVNEIDGVWGSAISVKGLQRLKADSSTVLTLSCATPFSCSAVGSFSAPGNNAALVVSTKPHH
jgi:hypothetical protein